jgi:peroxiredoxin (alkyl hydroperoxide reductase subunit C)
MSVQVRSAAPAFSLPALLGNEETTVSLADYKGKWVVFAWYPKDDTAVCASELPVFSSMGADLASRDAVLIAASTQDVDSKKAWVEGSLGTQTVPLAADFGGKVARDYGILLDIGLSLRATFIIDPEGIVRWQCVHDLPIGRSSAEILRVLDALQSGGACLVDWNK